MVLFVNICILWISISASWIDKYNTIWKQPGLTQFGSLPIGNGDLTANVWLDIDNSSNNNNYNLYLSFTKSDSYDLTGQRLKMIQLKLSYNPAITNTSKIFQQILYVSNATISINTFKYNISIWIDINSHNLNIQTINNHNTNYSLTSEIISWRKTNNFNVSSTCGDNLCYNPNIVPIISDTILQYGCNNTTDSLIFFHRNIYEGGISQYEWELNEQQLGFLLHSNPDPFYNLTWGAVLTLPFSKIIKTNTLSAEYTNNSLLNFKFLTQQTDSLNEWIDTLCVKNVSENHIQNLHQEWWDNFWNRSYVEIISNSSETFLISSLYIYRRYLDALQGRSNSNKSIKFNGESFWIDCGQGIDYKKWGSSYWWQNTRQPYYNTIICGDIDFNIPFYNQFLNQLKLIQARNKIYYNHSGGFFGETFFANGIYNEAEYGYKCRNGTIFDAFKMNSYIRFHWVSGLELINMLFDEYDWYLNDNIIINYILPISNVILTHYIQHYSINKSDGKLDMFPAQSLETWQCDSVNRSNCVTNPVEQISGLMVITKRLLNLPTNFGNITQRNLWKHILDIVPNIPLMKSHGVNIVSPGKLLPPKHMNMENSELYTVHPFKIYQFYKPNLTLAINTYKYRRFPCNYGWCQDILDTSILGLINETKTLLIERAQQYGNNYGWKWIGFAGAFLAWAPDLDHGSWMRTAIHYMLIQNNYDTNQIYLLPTWPCEWKVKFKLYAKNNTLIILDYDGNGKVNQLIVKPKYRLNDIKYVNCVSSNPT